MKKGQTYEGNVLRVDFPNKGIVACGGNENDICVIKDVLPDQKVSFSVTKKRNGRAEGRLLDVIEKSPYEIESPCAHFGKCGGCTYLKLPYDKQLELKSEQVKRLLDNALCKQDAPWEFEGIKGSPIQFEYRNKMEFSFGDEYKDGPLALGLHKKGSFYDIEPVMGCVIVDEDYRTILRATLDFFKGTGLKFYHKLRHEGYLRHLLVRKARYTGQIMVAIVTSSETSFDMDVYRNMLLSLEVSGEFRSILHIVNDSLSDVVRADEMKILYGDDYITEKVLGLEFRISVFSFFQTNTLSAEVLYSTVRDYVGDKGNGKVVYDLYSGTGTITQLMAPVAKKVIGVEIIEEAVEAARENARSNGLTNCEFIAGDVLKVLDELTEKPDLIILDPPRDGIHPKALGKILSYGIESMIYVSCKPTSLARDLESFLLAGYVVKKVCCIDQFPGSSHVEVCCLLEQLKSAKEHIEITIDAEDYYRIKDSEKETE
ncbi:MAG: 23S rRNA (uracil(1939)-C(5))-methyltransferase RlmD [Lachnospiraceae bacterium]|nr:23S rRNA (uracil(1939)-C(5))-methyltransferase RlmD [Lachnospiraceae bacterium]